MTFFQAIVLGAVQGVTEFLPISSTAHLRLLPSILGWNDPGAAASAIIQLGTMIAVVSFFRRDLANLIKAFFHGIFAGKPFEEFEARLGWYIAVGTIPIGLCGILFQRFIETSARSLYVIAGSLIALALILALAERFSTLRREVSSVTLKDSVVVGIAQALALIPGSSRSGTTISAGLFIGLTREAAARFSFLLSVPAVLASGLFQAYEIRHSLGGIAVVNLFVATVISAFCGYGAIGFVLRYLRTHTTYVFIWYRILLGGLILFLLYRETIDPFS